MNDFNLTKIVTSILLGQIPIIEMNPETLEHLQGIDLGSNSFVAYINADEKYEKKFNFDLIKFSNVKAIIRPYSLNYFRFQSLTLAIISGLNGSATNFNFVMPKRFLRWMLEGFGMIYRQIRIKNLQEKYNKISISIPLGYTDLFAESFLKFHSNNIELNSSERNSLVKFALKQNSSANYRKTKFVFIGQSGQIVRQFGIRATSKRVDSKILERSYYGGANKESTNSQKNGKEYVELLHDAQVSVCPPGNISGNSYRIYESVICNAFPAVMNNVLCDPLFEAPIHLGSRLRQKVSWESYLEFLSNLEPIKLQNENFKILKGFIGETRSTYEALCKLAY